MRTYLIKLAGVEPFTVNATDRTAARVYALELHGYTPAGPAPRSIVVIPV